MYKYLSVLLSFCLIFSSVSPSYAEILHYLVPRGANAAANAVQAAEKNSLRMATLNTTRHLEVATWKPFDFKNTPSQQLYKGGRSLSTVVSAKAPFSASADRAKKPGDFAGDISKQLKDGVEKAIQQAEQARLVLLNQFTPEEIGNFSPAQSRELIEWVFRGGLNEELKRKYFLNIIPQLVVLRNIALTDSQRNQLIKFYKDTLKRVNARAPLSDEHWGQAMAAASNLGLLASPQDTQAIELLLNTARSAPVSLKSYTDVVLGRAFLSLGHENALRELASLSARREGSLGGLFWQDIERVFQENGLQLGTPVNPERPLSLDPVAEKGLARYNPLNALHLDISPQATADWVALRVNIRPVLQDAPSAMGASLPAGRPAVQIPAPTTPLKQITKNLATPAAVSADPLPEGLLVSAANGPLLQTQQPQETKKIVSKTKKPLFAKFSVLSNPQKSANKLARSILDKPRPLATQLRDIVYGGASDHYKKQALLKLYQDQVFDSFLAAQPEHVRQHIRSAATASDLAERLLGLYEAKYLDPSLQAITNVLEQGSLLAELQKIVSQADWDDKARSAYEAETVLPLTGEDTFEGFVPTVPEADPKGIVDTFRPAGFAVSNQYAQPKITKKGVYYKNNIPFYYRNAKGELSSAPVGILSQTPANWYGRMLSAIGCAQKPGLTVPSGFVLALDEQGQWKFLMPRGNLSLVENNRSAQHTFKKMEKEGSVRVKLDTPYTSTDLLAMAHMLEHRAGLNLELTLNTPHSLSKFLTMHAFFVGNDAGNSLTGPFKQSLKGVQGLSNTLANGVSGIGYATPIAGGYAMPTMSRWGNVKTTKTIYALSAGALAFSLVGLGMNGFVDPSSIPLAGLAIPTVALVLGASLANSFVPTFLNFYKDPAARTAANLDFSTKKQASRLALTAITAAGAFAGINWTIVVPVGLSLLVGSSALFINTPMYKEAQAARKLAKLPNTAAPEKASKEVKKAKAKETEEYVKQYKEFRNNLPEMRDIRSRVKMVYASYAASLMMLGQAANEVLPAGMGQGFIAACMAATWATRHFATKWVKSSKVTDDQLTGISLPLLATTGGVLALAPYSSSLAVLTAAAAMLHYMATAVPGQLDAARMQNIVTAHMQTQKQEALADPALSDADKAKILQELTAKERVWSAQASKDYSLYNSRGLWGIGAATGGALLFADMGPQWTKDVLNWISSWLDAPTPSLALNRLIFTYSTAVASVLAWKNKGLTRDFFSVFGSKKITAEKIQSGQISAKNFGINSKNAPLRLVDAQKTIKTLDNQLVDYGISSEQKMTDALKQLVLVQNRLVALAEIMGPEKVSPAFEELGKVTRTYAAILNHNDLSVMLRREFSKLQASLYNPDTDQVWATPHYVEEGLYELPNEYDAYESSRRLVSELDQLSYTLTHGKTIDYDAFVTYLNRVRTELLRYEQANPADTPRAAKLTRQVNAVCKLLYKYDVQYDVLSPAVNDSQQTIRAKQRMRDVLAAYKPNK